MKRHHPAFTIVELLIVIVVIGILASITIVAYNGIQNRARSVALLSDAKQASTQLELIKADTGSYPTNADTLKKSSGITYDYTTHNGNYCLTATSTNEQSVHTSSVRQGQPDVGPCPVGHWSFDGNANDSSIYGNHGTVNGATLTSDREGNGNSAYAFDGVSQYIDVASYSEVDYSQSYTISAWTNPSRFSNPNSNCGDRRTYIVGQALDSYNYTSLGTRLSNSFYFYQNGTPGGRSVEYSNNITTNQWYHLAIVVNKSISRMNLLLNGEVIGSADISGYNMSNPSASNTPLRFGHHVHNCANTYFQGLIDDVRIYDQALFETEIKQLYEAK